MSIGKDAYMKELLDKYNFYKDRAKKANKEEYMISFNSSLIYRQHMREIANRFEKVFHEPIDNYIKKY